MNIVCSLSIPTRLDCLLNITRVFVHTVVWPISLHPVRPNIHYRSGEPTKIRVLPLEMCPVAVSHTTTQIFEHVYIGLGKNIEGGARLWNNRCSPPQHLRHGEEKLKRELSLSREARRLVVDVALLRDAGEHKDVILKQWQQRKEEEKRETLREYEESKDADERNIAALNKNIAAVELRIRLPRAADISRAPVQVPGAASIHPANCSVPIQRELYLQAQENNDDNAEGPEEEAAPGSIIPEAYSNIGPEFNIPKGLAFASETFSRSQRRPRKRKSQKKTATHSASKTSDCAPHCRTSKQRQFNWISNYVETRCFRKFSRRSKHHVTHRSKIF